MKKLLLYLISVFLPAFLSAQQLYFSQATNIPVQDSSGTFLQNAWAGGINWPLFSAIDVDGDGLKDLYVFDKSNNLASVFINDGSTGIHAYHNAPQYVSRFPKVRTDAWGMCYDYNCDGKADFFALDSLFDGIEVWRNDYTGVNGLRFTKVSNELLEDWSGPQPINIYATSIYLPSFIDIDNDGDMDIIAFNNPPNGKFSYHKNLSMETWGTCDSLSSFLFDDKCWGNFQLGLGSNTVSMFHTTPCPQPVPPPKGGGIETAKRDDTITTVCALDIDGDGVKELLIGDQASPNSLLVHNGGTAASAEMDVQDVNFPTYDVPVSLPNYVHHAYIDVDNDGKRDLLACAGTLEDKAGVWFYKNTNTDAAPIFSFQKNNYLQNEMLDVGQGACPVFFDADADGLKDLVIAHGEYVTNSGVVSRLSLYKNVGTATAPAFQFVTNDYASLSNYNLFFPIAVTFGDIDGDGDQDMLIGDFAGQVHLFNNSAGAGNPASFLLSVPTYMGIDVGNNATPQLVDMDNDGVLDLVIGEQDHGFLNYYHNSGTTHSAAFTSAPTRDTLGNIILAQPSAFNGYGVPFIFSYSGSHQMLTANMHGDIYYYDNIDNNLNGTFTRIDTVLDATTIGERTTGANIYVSGGDINNDGLMDMVVGLFSGGVKIYYGSSIPISVSENEMPEMVQCYPNPAVNKFTIHDSQFAMGAAVTITLYNMLGVAVQSEIRNPKSEINVDVSTLANGMYIVEVTSGKTIQHSRVIIQH